MSYPKHIAQSQVLNISCYRIKAAPALFDVSYSTRNGVVSQYVTSGEFATNYATTGIVNILRARQTAPESLIPCCAGKSPPVVQGTTPPEG
jgi:hypothetical protein